MSMQSLQNLDMAEPLIYLGHAVSRLITSSSQHPTQILCASMRQWYIFSFEIGMFEWDDQEDPIPSGRYALFPICSAFFQWIISS